MLSGIGLILFFLVMIVVMILAISKLKLHPFLAIMGVAIVLAFVAEGAGGQFLNLTETVTNANTGLQEVSATSRGTIIGSIGVGFSAIFSSIGIVIIFGALIGGILEATGGAFKIADMIVRLLGKASPTLAMLLMGWVISIPVFCDSGFVIANPVRKSIVKRTKASGIATGIALGAGLYTSHVLIPLTPGPLAASEMLGMGDQLITVMWVSVIISVPSLIAAYFFAKWRGRKDKSEEDLAIQDDKTVKSYEELVKEFGGLPSGFLSLAPILMPVLFMAIGSIVNYNIYDAANASGIEQFFVFLGAPVVALGIGVLFGVVLLASSGKLEKFAPVTNDTLKMLGPILFITAAGATLGRIVNDSDIIPFIRDNADAITWMGIAFPFVVSAILKTAQGSSTVAMMVTAGLMSGGLMDTMGFTSPIAIALVVMAIGAGSMMASHANDSYFWVVSKLSGQTPQQGYKNWTSMTVVQGLAVMAGIAVFYGIYSIVS